jgi:hypothetical protein
MVMKCIASVAILSSAWGPNFQDSLSELSKEEREAVEEYLHMFVTGPVACPPSSVELIHRFGPGLVPYLAGRMIEEPKYRSLCAQLLSGLAGRWGSMDSGSEKALIRVLKAGGNGAVYAASALGSLCSEQARPDLLKAAESGKPYLVKAACLSLGLMGGEEVRDTLLRIQASWQTRDSKPSKEVLRAVADALDMMAAFEGDGRQERLLKMMKAAKPYGGMGWLYSSDRAALRKAIKLKMKELLPDLRRMANANIDWNLPLLLAIHTLGGEVGEAELKALRRHVFLMPLKKWTTGYLDDN